MSLLDLILIGIVLSFTLVSAAWGVVRQVMAVGGLLLGIILASNLSEPVSKWLGFISDPQVARGVAFIGIIIVVSLIVSIAASVLYFVVGLLFLGLADHLLGAVLGFIQGVLAIGVFFVAALLVAPDWVTQQYNTSFLANKLIGPMTDLALLVAPTDLKDLVHARIPK